MAFDQFGLCHGIELRPGNTKPGDGAADFIERVFKDHRECLAFFSSDFLI